MIEEIYILRGTNRKELKDIITKVESNDLNMTELQKGEIDKICRTSKHQGVAARIKEFRYTDFSRITSKPGNKKSCSVIVILDHIEDPHNFGAILRTSGFFNVDGVVIPKDRAVPVTPAVIKVSAGAVSTIPVSRVTNLSNTIKKLKDKGYWIVGSDTDAETVVGDLDINDLDIAVVVGNESSGMSDKLKKMCDFMVNIKGPGSVGSLNVSVATGILLYEIKRSVNVN